MHKRPLPSPADACIYICTPNLLYFRVSCLPTYSTSHTAMVFVALISFYELRTSGITALNTIGAATVSSCIAAFLSRLENDIYSVCRYMWNLSNARLVDLQEAESSHSLMLVRSLAVRSMACKRYTVNKVVAESHTNRTHRATNRSHKINHDAP